MKRLLLTGGVGFIGSHTVSHFLEHTDWEIIVMDRLTYAGNQNFLVDDRHYQENKERVKFIYHDFRSPVSETTQTLIGHVDYVIHMGAESHVDRSIDDPLPFAYSNVVGTVNMLEYAKIVKPELFIYISTDEVYGPSINGHLHVEGEPHRPSNPYSASKSGAEAFCYAYWNTYNMPIIITNTMNNYGERQNNEKFVMKTIKRLLNDEEMIAHCKIVDGDVVDVSSRYWLHARNHADGLLFLLEHGKAGERYNLVGEWASVDEVIKMIAGYLDVEAKIKYEDFHSFRPGHDMHYGLDGTKMKEMGWVAPIPFESSLKRVVDWTRDNPKWL
ncbi:MAG TPA: GDP-mannose 4,6-dehydratase [Candidatus Glassbacteria bacterium]|nr:GDP-mannose 4,6-dehydratase [Candidatus Glassbacteria bacterium]